MAQASEVQRPSGRWRQIVSIVLIVLGVIATPAAVVGVWARSELVDTDAFVATLAPLATQDDVQALVVDQVVSAVEQQVSIPAVLQQPFHDFVGGIISSPAFAQLWKRVLDTAHAEAIAAIRGEPSAAIHLADDGTLSLQLGIVTDAVREQLVQGGSPLAPLIPQVDASVTIVQSDALPQVRAGYGLATTLGYWLPAIAAVLLLAGVLVARRRMRALAWAALGAAVALAAVGVVLALAPGIAAGAAGPSSAAGVGVIVEQLVATPRTATFVGAGIALVVGGAAAWVARRGGPWGRAAHDA